jgi:hypothetical protein
LGVLARDQCKVTDRKPTYDENNEPVIKTLYEGVISTDITETEKTKRYKVELHDGEVKCIIDNGQITAVEITGHGTMESNNKNKYTGHFEKGLKHSHDEGGMYFPDLKRTYKGTWTHGTMSPNGTLLTTLYITG